MRYTTSNRGFPAGNPIANALVIIVGTLLIAMSLVVGFVAFVVFGSLLLIMAAIVGIRMWWFSRRMRKEARKRSVRHHERSNRAAIEGEYEVVDDRERS